MTRELDSRFSDGIDVRLLWDSADGRVSVAVNDTKTGEAFELEVPDQFRARDVFEHPYAQQRVAAQFEEVVVDSDRFRRQDAFPDGEQFTLR